MPRPVAAPPARAGGPPLWILLLDLKRVEAALGGEVEAQAARLDLAACQRIGCRGARRAFLCGTEAAEARTGRRFVASWRSPGGAIRRATPVRTGEVETMLKSLRMLGEDLRAKSKWCYKSDRFPAMVKVLATDGTLAMVLYRLMQGSRESNLAPLEMVFNKLNSIYSNCVIGRGTEFGPGFVIFHSNGVVINGKVRGGSNVHLHHEVTLGDNEAGESPMLGSNIHIGAGAKIIGGVTVGDGARIGANAVVVHDVTPHTTVVGIPARPVRRRQEKLNEASSDISTENGASRN